MKRFGGVSRPLFAFAKPVAVTSALALLSGTRPADAAGFYIKEQSVTGLGRAFAGESAMSEDASTIFFNPAGMTRLKGPEATAGLHRLLHVSADGPQSLGGAGRLGAVRSVQQVQCGLVRPLRLDRNGPADA